MHYTLFFAKLVFCWLSLVSIGFLLVFISFLLVCIGFLVFYWFLLFSIGCYVFSIGFYVFPIGCYWFSVGSLVFHWFLLVFLLVKKFCGRLGLKSVGGEQDSKLKILGKLFQKAAIFNLRLGCVLSPELQSNSRPQFGSGRC